VLLIFDQRAQVAYRRGGETRELWLSYTPVPLPIRFILRGTTITLGR